MLIAKGIHKSYGSLEVLKGVDLEISKGEIVSFRNLRSPRSWRTILE